MRAPLLALALALALVAAAGCDRTSKKADPKPPADTCVGQPYSPVQGGSCTPFMGEDRFPFVDPAGLKGSYCAPPCTGIAKACPAVKNTSAEGTCFFITGDTEYCTAWCRVDAPPGSPQCPCGATCQPYGPNDKDGNLRGVCLFK